MHSNSQADVVWYDIYRGHIKRPTFPTELQLAAVLNTLSYRHSLKFGTQSEIPKMQLSDPIQPVKTRTPRYANRA
jgi:hypothetical protein